MSFIDKTLQCSDCGKDFIFTAGEQEFFANKGFSDPPKRCTDCRAERKAKMSARDGGGSQDTLTSREYGGRPKNPFKKSDGPKPRYPATCSRCGTNFEAPFQPAADRPVFCRDCFQQNKKY